MGRQTVTFADRTDRWISSARTATVDSKVLVSPCVLRAALEVQARRDLRHGLDPVVPAHTDLVAVVPQTEFGRLAEQ